MPCRTSISCTMLFEYGFLCSAYRHNQSELRKAKVWSSGLYRPHCAPGEAVLSSARSFILRSAWRYISVVFTDSCPSQRAITLRSIPCSSSSIAVVWRSTWGDTCFRCSDLHLRSAVAVCLATMYSIPSRLRCPPLELGNTGSCGSEGHSRNQL